MINPALKTIWVNGTLYGYIWFDFLSFMRLDVYENNRLIGSRRAQIGVDEGERTIAYMIKRIVGNHGTVTRITKTE